MIKDVVVNLSLGADRDPACDYAISVAHVFNSHLAGIVFAYDPIVSALAVGGGWEMMTPKWVEEQRAKAAAAANAAVVKFEEAARLIGISADARVLTVSVEKAADLFGKLARRFDLLIVRQNEPRRPGYEDLLIEAALFDSGRPVLVVPYIQTEGPKLDHVLVCWDGSRHTARAVADAGPFLARARMIEVVTIGAEVKSEEISGADIAHHLARHGLNIELKNIAAPDLDVSNAILSHAADVSADFMVMGGYGHSRLREFILGGATRGILATMTVPTLMSH
jgi:nucleotide-binding universal stress UspA family protein